ncbi:MAG: folate-binding protein [Bombella apis]|nr:folate-binding protein [Bombella apis]
MRTLMKRNHLSHRSVISLTGNERASFLQGLITNDVLALPPQQSCWAALLNAQGRIESLFFLWKTEDALYLDITAAQAESIIKTLKRFRLRADVQIDLTEYGILTGTPENAPPEHTLITVTDPRHPSLGWRAICPPSIITTPHHDTTLASLEHRLTIGVPDDADIIPGQTLVLEANMDYLHGVSWEKGCYLGQEVTARTHYRGLIKKRILPISSRDGIPFPADAAITLDGQEVGELRSYNGSHGLALLHRRAWEATNLMLGPCPITLNWPDWLPREEMKHDTAGQ